MVKEVREGAKERYVKMFLANPRNLVGTTFLRVSSALRTPMSDLRPTMHCIQGRLSPTAQHVISPV